MDSFYLLRKVELQSQVPPVFSNPTIKYCKRCRAHQSSQLMHRIQFVNEAKNGTVELRAVFINNIERKCPSRVLKLGNISKTEQKYLCVTLE